MDIPVLLVDLVLKVEAEEPVVLLTFREASAAKAVLAVLQSHARLMEPPALPEQYGLIRRRAVVDGRSLDVVKGEGYTVDEHRIAEEWADAQQEPPEEQEP